jgi:hypothetical protein
MNHVTGGCDTCTVGNCNECEFLTDGVGGSTESCLLCDVGYSLMSDGTCRQRSGSDAITLYVLEYKGFLMSSNDLTAM